jgi:hypothetical protein
MTPMVRSILVAGLIGLPAMSVAQTAIGTVDGICTSPDMSYEDRLTAIAQAGWTDDVSEGLKRDWAVSTTTIDWLGMLANNPGPELDGFLVTVERRYAPVDGSQSQFWQFADETAVLRISNTALGPNAQMIACEYTGMTDAGSVDAVMESSRFADMFKIYDMLPIAVNSAGADGQGLRDAASVNVWPPSLITERDFLGPRDVLADGASFRFPVNYTAVSQLITDPA